MNERYNRYETFVKFENNPVLAQNPGVKPKTRLQERGSKKRLIEVSKIGAMMCDAIVVSPVRYSNEKLQIFFKNIGDDQAWFIVKEDD